MKFLNLLVKKDNKLLIFKLILFLVLIQPSCKKPTYPKERLIFEAERLLKKEGNLEGNLKLIGKTMFLQIEIPKEEIITEERKILQKAIKKIEKASIIITRLALSTDAEVEFLVTLAKVKNQDFCVRIINRLNDIKDFIYMKISRGDYEKRLIFEMLPYSKVSFEELKFEEFIARLIASNYNMFIRTNPFAGALLLGTTLEFEKLENDLIIFSINMNKENLLVKPLFENFIFEYFLDIKIKYKDYKIPNKIIIIDKQGKELTKISLQ